VREECHKNRHERYACQEEHHVFAVVTPLARRIERVRDEVVKYDDKVRARRKTKQPVDLEPIPGCPLKSPLE